MKLKDKIKRWLFSDEIKRIEFLENIYKKINELVNTADRAYLLSVDAKKNYDESQKELVDCKKMINQICDVGVDVGFSKEEHSWAIVCVSGRPEYVKFIPLNRGDARQVIDFLKQFQYSNHIIDSPLAFRNILRREMFFLEK